MSEHRHGRHDGAVVDRLVGSTVREICTTFPQLEASSEGEYYGFLGRLRRNYSGILREELGGDLRSLGSKSG